MTTVAAGPTGGVYNICTTNSASVSDTKVKSVAPFVNSGLEV